MPPPKKPRCRDAPWFFLAREGLSARPEWARNRRWTMPCNVSVRGAFQLTPSARRATKANLSGTASTWNFNPRPPRGGRRFFDCQQDEVIRISIHALREEGDSASTVLLRPHPYFNPRPPRGGRRKPVVPPSVRWKFQSTPSARRATRCPGLPPHRLPISIHALREEGDAQTAQQGSRTTIFQSTPSARRATSHRSFARVIVSLNCFFAW